jgi:hypothetical protein
MKIIEVKIWNSDIQERIGIMIQIAKACEDYTIQSVFNKVTVNVNSDSDKNLIFKEQQRLQFSNLDKTVGPYPKN